MIAILLLLLAVLISSGVGRSLLTKLDLLRDSPLEAFVFSTALGLGIGAYGVFFIGLVGLRSFWPITLWWLFLAVCGFAGTITHFKEFRDYLRRVRSRKILDGTARRGQTLLVFCLAAVLVTLIGIIFLACFKPPGSFEWDVLSYHLADPKVFLSEHRITRLPTEHHSNFPFLMEMLFTVGLMYNGYVLANMFHALMSVLTVLMLIAFGRKCFSPVAGWTAATMYLTTPLILGEAGTAYIDLGLAFYVLLASCAAVQAMSFKKSSATEKMHSKDSEKEALRWVILAGTMAGFALGIKYLALLPFGLIGIIFLIQLRSIRIVSLYVLFALMIASPWYIKNLVLTRNPVYPYLYKLFPASQDWSADRARNAESEQNQFGYPHQLSEPGTTLRGILSVPWRLLTESDRYSNKGEYTFMTLIGGLYAAFNLPMAFRRRLPPGICTLLWLAILQLAAWFMLAQVARYLILILPLLALTGGYFVSTLLTSNEVEKTAAKSQSIQATISVCLLLGQAILTFWGVLALPSSPSEVMQTGLMPTALSVPEILDMLTKPKGTATYLNRYLETYRVMDWINNNTPKDAGIILYDDVRGFYLDRRYLWGNAEHSAYIPYDTFRDGRQLTDWMLRNHYQYALINMKYSPHNSISDPKQRDPVLPSGPANNEVEARQRWYEYAAEPEDSHWRALVGDALRNRLWVGDRSFGTGVVLVRIGPQPQTHLEAPRVLAQKDKP